MKVNKDLVDAIMMLSFIGLVLVGTSEFDSETTKNIMMGVLGILAIAMVALRFVKPKHHDNNNELAD